MLQLKIPEKEFFIENSQEFIPIEETTLQLEHSLISLSKWESKWKIPFLADNEKTNEQMIDYIRCMSINKNVDPNVYSTLSNDLIQEVNDYIENPMTATWFNENDRNPMNREIVTAEIIYYWMIVQNIPFECQKWHLNRLLTLIRVCSIKNAPEKKMSKRELINRNRELNKQRRSKANSKG